MCVCVCMCARPVLLPGVRVLQGSLQGDRVTCEERELYSFLPDLGVLCVSVVPDWRGQNVQYGAGVEGGPPSAGLFSLEREASRGL